MYRETLPQADVSSSTATKPQPAQTVSKVNRICNAFLDVLLPSRLSTKLQNIVTAYVCKSPPDHDAALLLIAKLREENTELVEKAVEHVCWLADANKLYNNALGLYNLELTLLVAQQSQKVLFPSHFWTLVHTSYMEHRTHANTFPSSKALRGLNIPAGGSLLMITLAGMRRRWEAWLTWEMTRSKKQRRILSNMCSTSRLLGSTSTRRVNKMFVPQAPP